jgi:UDP-N-acetyl-D-glucosamine/UDP-N-acetyl-D-galactosamine dehydrogenase
MSEWPISRESVRIAVLGLGYVGSPLAVYFGRHFPTLGFDIDLSRIKELKNGHDRTGELKKDELKLAKKLAFTTDAATLKQQNFFVVTVPTPIDDAKRPDFSPLIAASKTVGGAIKRGGVVVYESTVYPGATEEICIPIIEQVSGLKYNEDFFAGYSPERINPADPVHRLPAIKKIVPSMGRS